MRAAPTPTNALIIPSVRAVHEYEVICDCGNRWRIEAATEPDQAECAACGADAFTITDLGEIRR